MYYDTIPQEILDNTTFCPRDGGEGFWQIHTIGMYVGEQDMTSLAAPISVIDSGTTLFYLNKELHTAIVN